MVLIQFSPFLPGEGQASTVMVLTSSPKEGRASQPALLHLTSDHNEKAAKLGVSCLGLFWLATLDQGHSLETCVPFELEFLALG